MLTVLQNSPFTPLLSEVEGDSGDASVNDNLITPNNVVDYSNQGEDVHSLQDSEVFSQDYYKYKNDTVTRANTTIEFLISNLWDSTYKGFNESDAIGAKKRTFDNMLMIITLLEYYNARGQSEYVTYAEDIFKFEYNYLWDNQTKLFLSYCDYNGNNPSALINSTDNILAIIALLKLYRATYNQTYLNIANQTYGSFNTIFYDSTYGGYYRSNLSGDTNKYAYDNFLVSRYLSEISQYGYFQSEFRMDALQKAEGTLNLLISHYLNGTLGFFTQGDREWNNPVKDKSALINSLAVDALVSVYESNSNQTYLDIAVDVAEFLDNAFWDSTGVNRGYNTTVNWDGSVTLNSTKYLEENSLIMKAFLEIFAKSYNSTHYLNALKTNRFLNSYLWDYNSQGFNYSVDFSNIALNSSLKSTAQNAWAIQALLSFRYPRPYLTRANTTMSLIHKYMYGENLFDNLIMYDWSSLASQVVLSFPRYTLEDVIGVYKTPEGNLLAIYTLLELAEETGLMDYVAVANKTMYALYQQVFSHAFKENTSQGGNETQTTYHTETNAWGILSLLKLYEKTGDTLFLEMANETWYYLRDNLWDSTALGYNTSIIENSTKSIVANCLMIWANLEIANSTYAIFNPIRNEASLYANQTITVLNQKMWSQNYGYYTNASSDWTPITTEEIVKRTFENSIMIMTLLKYNSYYQNNPNKTLFEERVNQTVAFLLNNLWDWEIGGFYIGCNETGDYQDTNKTTYGNNWAALAFLELYETTGNFTYYLLAEEINNFVNTYLWDYEYGGYFYWCSQEGLPYVIGTYPTLIGDILLSFKFLENQISSILMLSRLSSIKNDMTFPLIVDIELQPEQFDRGPLTVGITLHLIDVNGAPITQANLTIFRNGVYKSVEGEKLYSFAKRYDLENQNGLNNYTGRVDISPFSGSFHLSILAYNSSMAMTWFLLSGNRSFDVYLSKAFSLVHNMLLFFYDSSSGGFKREFTTETTFTLYTFDNWITILALLDYYEGSGLNVLYNLTTLDLQQSLLTYISHMFNFLNGSLRYMPVNETALAFFSSIKQDTGEINPTIYCRDTALAIITLVKYYQITKNSVYLEMANQTWEYLNSTFWDSTYLGYKDVNGTFGNQTKYSIDNIWAIMADLTIYNSSEINAAVRNSALNMANLTITKMLEKIWDNEYGGFFTSYNGTTWVPFNTSYTCKQTEVNALAIQMLIEFAKLTNASHYENYINYANKTFLFMANFLKDKQFLGYFSSCDRNGTEFNTNKTLMENSMMILSLLDLYAVNNNNYTYYQFVEELLLFLDTYFKSTYATVYHNVSSRFGAITYNFNQYVPVEGYSNAIFLQCLTETDLTRQKLEYPLEIQNINVEKPQLGEIQDTINITLEIVDSNGNPIENATVLGVIYGKYQRFSFVPLKNNTYYCLFNVSNLQGSIEINIQAYKDGYSAGRKRHVISRTFPVYVQKAYETLIALLLQLWGNTRNIFVEDEENFEYKSISNFYTINSFLDFIGTGGNILWIFDWFANRTFLSYAEIVARNLNIFLNSSPVQVDGKNVSGYVSETQSKIPINKTDVASNAMAIITFLKLYDMTNNTLYLELANNTWLYLNATFWDPTNYGYFSDNSTSSGNKSIFDNCLAIWANLAINETLEINSSIRNQAFLLANLTFSRINQSLWDDINGTYYFYCDSDWSNPRERIVDGNALMIQTLIRLYLHNPSKISYLRMANITAELLMKYYYDSVYGGFFTSLSDNLSLPISIDKSLESNAWAILALTELYNLTRNSTLYYKAEDAMNFVNSYLANHYNEYLNTQIGDINGYWDSCNRSGVVPDKTKDVYVGSLKSSALIIQALLKIYYFANLTLPWLNATVRILPASELPAGDYCNITITIFNENDIKVPVTLNITMVGWKRWGDQSVEMIVQQLDYEYDSNSQEYKVKNINLTTVEDIYFCIYAKNESYIVWWNVYYIHRTGTNLFLWGVEGDYIPSEDYWQYTIAEDLIIIEGWYVDYTTYEGIPDATLNFTVYFPNATVWFSELVITNATGWGRFVFGPVPNIAELFGRYNITVFATHANTSITPITWYASISGNISINIDYGVSIPYFYPLESIVPQGDKIQCNVTIKHRMLSNLSVDILIYSEGVLIPTHYYTNLTTGYNYFLIETEVDERTPIGLHYIYVNVSFENKVIRDTYFFITILSAAVIRDFYAPTWIAEGDVRYAAIEIEHRKQFETSNISIKVNCPALKENPTIQVLPALSQQVYYYPLYLKEGIPYGTYSGEIIVQRVNYTLDFNGEPLTFQIEVRPTTQIIHIQLPSEIAQNQQTITAIEIQNNKLTSITIKVIGFGDGFNYYEGIFSIDPAESSTINTPIIYYKSPWDAGLREYTIEIYYLNTSDEFELISSNTFQINIKFSTNNILLGFILPSVAIAVIIVWFLLYRDKKKRERKKLK